MDQYPSAPAFRGLRDPKSSARSFGRIGLLVKKNALIGPVLITVQHEPS
jgi:hypothetical protein